MKKIKMLTSLPLAVVLATAPSILSSCSKTWDDKIEELTTNEKELTVTYPKTSCVYSLVLKEKLNEGEYIAPSIEVKSVSDKSIALKVDEKASMTEKLVCFTVTMENLPQELKDFYVANFNVTLTCKKVDNTISWTTNALCGFSLTVKKA